MILKATMHEEVEAMQRHYVHKMSVKLAQSPIKSIEITVYHNQLHH